MKKLALFVITMIASMNVVAATATATDLGDAVSKTMKKQESTSQTSQPAVIYGGQDLTHRIVA